MEKKNFLLWIILTSLQFSLFCVNAEAVKKPLEGDWKSTDKGIILRLNNDNTFSWGDLTGKWILDNKDLYLHSPGKLVSYQIELKGSVLLLSGSNKTGEPERFSYNSPGKFVPLKEYIPAATRAISDVQTANTSDPTSLADYLPELDKSNLSGAWVAVSKIGIFDTIRFHSNGEALLTNREHATYKMVEDRIYVSRRGVVEEWFFTIESSVLGIAYDQLTGPRAYQKLLEPAFQYYPTSFTPLTGTYKHEREAPITPDNPDGVKTYTDELTIGPGDRVNGSTLSDDGETIKIWGGHAAIVHHGIEIRYDDGSLRNHAIVAELHPEYGRLLKFDGKVFTILTPEISEEDTQLRMYPFDAERVRRYIASVVEKTLEQISANLDTESEEEDDDDDDTDEEYDQEYIIFNEDE